MVKIYVFHSHWIHGNQTSCQVFWLLQVYQYPCSFRKQGRPNLTHFDNACKFCGNSVDFVPCSASKVWEFKDCCQSVKVYHHGYHTCPVIAQPDVKEASDALKKFFANPEMKPRKAVASIITEAIKENHTWYDVECLTEGLINPNLPKNIKLKVRKKLHPEGHSFEAVQLLKTGLTKKTLCTSLT